MADAGFFKGTSADQDRRFADKEQKLLKSTKFPSHFDKKIDMRKVNLNVIKPWIAKKIVELIGFEDDILIGYAMELLDEPSPDPKKMQLLLTSFLTKDAPIFMSALWTLLLEAQTEVTGVPRTFVEEKKEEMRKAREGDTRAMVVVVAGDVGEAAGAEEEGLMTTVGVEVARETQAGVVGAEEAEEALLVVVLLPIVVPARALDLDILLRPQDAETVLRLEDGRYPATSIAPDLRLLQIDAEVLPVALSPGRSLALGRVLFLEPLLPEDAFLPGQGQPQPAHTPPPLVAPRSALPVEEPFALTGPRKPQAAQRESAKAAQRDSSPPS
ncbi:PWI domain-containing protein [Mycena leptocephala]|nr:PWI domain-containing protein [Mycena leptocephala]